ncbi:MAG: AAA family ATPase [Geminicoccaceae bacterium]|nr:AAA family ATPase [Geminicoccaceae bacterium]
MQFTRLRISGFKSFCDPCELEIRPGLTGIVGPNGCGKSNLVDALRWVLGEGSAKGLRGSEMEDVIFGGSVARAPRDLAEVGLLLEGPVDGFLVLGPGERAEIVRRIVRGVGSSWRIDGREVRQRDVALLLADAAVGARGVAIVSQGQIGLLVDARADERRRLLEEAAGISGLRLRRREAEQRLAETEANLARVRELAAGAQARLEELRARAAEAERYRRISAELRTVETALLLRRHREALASWEHARTALENALEEERALQERLERVRTERARRASERTRLRENLERATSEAARLAERLAAALARAERERAENEERARRRRETEADLEAVREETAALAAEIDARVSEREDLARTRAELVRHIEEIRERLAATERREGEATAARDAALAARLELASIERLEEEARRSEARALELARLLAAEDDGSDGLVRAEEALAAARAELEAARAREDELAKTLEAIETASARQRKTAAELANRLAGARAELAANEATARARELARRERAARLCALGRMLARLEEERKAAAARLAAIEDEVAGCDLQRLEHESAEAFRRSSEASEAERRAAEELRQAEAAVSEAANAAANARAALARIEAEEAALHSGSGEDARGGGTPIYARIGGARGLERALAAALGEDLFVGTDPSADRFWRLLEGQGTVAPLPEGVPSLAERLRAPPELARRLALTGLCSAEEAERLQPKLAPGQRLVSPEGGVWRWDGFVRRAGNGETERGLARLEALAAEREKARRTLAEASARLSAAERRRERAAAAAAAAAAACAEARAESERSERRLARARAILERAQTEQKRLRETLERLEAETAELAREHARSSEPEDNGPEDLALARARETVRSLEVEWRAAAARCEEREGELRRVRRELEAAREAVRRAAEELEARRAATLRAEQERIRRSARREALARERTEAEERARALREELARLEPERAQAAERLAAAETLLARAREERIALERRLSGLGAERDALEARLRSLEAERMRLVERKAALETRARELSERLARLLPPAAPESETPEALEALRRQATEAETRRRTAAAEVERAEREVAEAEGALAQLETRLAASIARTASCRAEEARSRAASEATRAAVQERLDRPPESFASWREPEELARLSLVELERRAARLRASRERMGPINLRAEQEALELERELARMRAEEAEIRTATARLSRAIATLDGEARERLLAVFAAVEDHFRRLFARLFGGGRGALRLSGLDDPLDAGLEIEAQPPGKRLAHVSLLSGGEKALAGLALVFAFFLARPSPLCVLDEVDAPLDDANVERLARLMTEIAREVGTRFLVVTHHPLTMSQMDRLYGVTMVERGVSRLVSVELARALELRLTA